VAIGVTTVTAREEALIVATREDHFADLKAIEVALAKLTRSMSGFANADGGDLFVGLDEDTRTGRRRWRGFEDVEAANGHIQAFEATFPLDQWVDYEFLESESHGHGLVLKASIRKTPDVRKASDGIAYVRRGAQNLPANTLEALRRLEYAKGVRSFETQPLDVPVAMVANSEAIIEFMLAVVPTAEPEPWLQKQLLVREGKPTVASVVLFADEPQAALPKQCAIKVYRYATTDETGGRATLQGQPLTIEGNLYRQIRQAVAVTVGLVEGIRILGPEGMEEVKYPEVTLHEIITNAVLHRDYSIADDVHVRIFDNRIEVESPGRLPAHITTANILEERFSRNGSIVRWINKFPDPPNKDVGEGLRTAFAAMKKLKLKEPEIQEHGETVLVQIRHQRLASPEEMILEYLRTHDEITNSIARGLTGIGSENRVKSIFQRMMRARELEAIPDRSLRYAAYRLPSPQPQTQDEPGSERDKT
jgi:ATP-dependent DNA helicase RecG